MKKKKIRIYWSCSNYVKHSHRYRWVAWLCGRLQYIIQALYRTRGMMSEPNEKELERLNQYFEECEFNDGVCDVCDTENKRTWYEKTSHESDEGNYYCDKCGLKKIKNDEEMYEYFEAEEKAADKAREVE